MTTHLRTRAIQVGAFLALAGGMIAVGSTPALADPPDVQINNVSATDLPAGGRATMRYTVTNENGVPGQVRIQVNGGGMNCSGDCSPATQLGPNESRQFAVQLTAPQVGDGQTRNITVQVNAVVNNNENASANQQFTVRGNDKPKTVRQVTGRVKDQDGKAVGGAEVGVRDSQGHSYRTTTNNDGRFAFTSSDSEPILAGTLTVGAVKSGFTQVTVSVQGTADKTLNVPLTLQGTAPPSASPSASVTASAPPTDEATDPATDAVPAATAPATDAASAKDSGSNSTLYIILGALLVAAGVGAIVLVLMRRKSGDDDGDDLDDDMPGGGPVPPSRGAFHDATRVGAPVGGGRNDATMIAHGGPSISDAPTMMHQAVPLDDEFPDPYGAPVPQAGYGAAGGGYGAPGQYGNPTYGGAPVPAQSGGYDPGPATQFGQPPIEDPDPYAAYGAAAGAGSGGYGAGGAQQRFDEPTGMYRPEPAGGYGQDQGYGAGGGYPGAAQPAPGGYGREPEPEYPAPRGERTGGYQAGNYGGAGYGGGQEPAADQGGYGYAPPARGGDYGAPGGAGYGGAGGGYGGQGSSYVPPAAGGYGADDDGYDQRGGYRSGQPYERGGTGYGGGAPAGGYGGGSGYGGGDQGGYPDQGGYGGGQGRGYGADQGGYDDPAGGGYYGGADDQRGGGRHGGQSRPPQPETSRPGQRRPLDWLDD